VAPRIPTPLPLRSLIIPFLIILLLLFLLIALLGFLRGRKPHKPGALCIFHGIEEEHLHPRSRQRGFHAPIVRRGHEHHREGSAEEQIHGTLDESWQAARPRQKRRG
jgi:hypothetical protein